VRRSSQRLSTTEPHRLYLDSSALVALFVSQPWSEEVERIALEFPYWVTHDISYAEVSGVFARHLWNGRMSEGDYQEVQARFHTIWLEGINPISSTLEVSIVARDLLKAHQPHLRAMDALHLAGALVVRRAVPIRFLTFDDRLSAIVQTLIPFP